MTERNNFMDSLWIEVVYASPSVQRLYRLDYKEMTAEQAIERSGVLGEFAEIDLAKNKIGIFAKQVRLSHRLNPGDRVEIYRSLVISPKDARRLRAAAK